MSTSSTCGASRSSAHCAMGLPRSVCRPLSTPPMRRPWPPARSSPVIVTTRILRVSFATMTRSRFLVPFINIGHLLDHLVMLVFPTVVIALGREWDRPYSELLPLALGGFIAFGAFAIPAGWLADHWSRYKMMAVFFFGIGAALFITGFAQAPWQIAVGLTLTGMFAAIYHPVGIAMLVASPDRMGRALGWNGLWGNLGLAAAALVSGALMDFFGWRAAFFVPGLASIAAGIGFLAPVPEPGPVQKKSRTTGLHLDARTKARISAILVVVTACRGGSFNSTTIATPATVD